MEDHPETQTKAKPIPETPEKKKGSPVSPSSSFCALWYLHIPQLSSHSPKTLFFYKKRSFVCKGIEENLRYGSVTNHTSFSNFYLHFLLQRNILYIFFFNIYLFGCTVSQLWHVGIFQLQHLNSYLWHVIRSSSLIL